MPTPPCITWTERSQEIFQFNNKKLLRKKEARKQFGLKYYNWKLCGEILWRGWLTDWLYFKWTKQAVRLSVPSMAQHGPHITISHSLASRNTQLSALGCEVWGVRRIDDELFSWKLQVLTVKWSKVSLNKQISLSSSRQRKEQLGLMQEETNIR